MKTVQQLMDAQLERHAANMAVLLDNASKINHIHQVLSDLGEAVTVTTFRLDRDSPNEFNISFTGPKEAFEKVWWALRTLHFKPGTRPSYSEKITNFCTSFYQQRVDEEGDTLHDYDKFKFWVNWHSSVCTLKQIGTKMVEQPIYEVICE